MRYAWGHVDEWLLSCYTYTVLTQVAVRLDISNSQLHKHRQTVRVKVCEGIRRNKSSNMLQRNWFDNDSEWRCRFLPSH